MDLDSHNKVPSYSSKGFLSRMIYVSTWLILLSVILIRIVGFRDTYFGRHVLSRTLRPIPAMGSSGRVLSAPLDYRDLGQSVN